MWCARSTMVPCLRCGHSARMRSAPKRRSKSATGSGSVSSAPRNALLPICLALNSLMIARCLRKKAAKQAAAAHAEVFALPCDQRQVKCGRCHQMRWLKKALPKTAEAMKEEEKKKTEQAVESARRKAEDDEVMKFLCRHAVGDEVTRPPCARQSFDGEWCVCNRW